MWCYNISFHQAFLRAPKIFCWTLLSNTSYILNPAPWDFHLFRPIKITMCGIRFEEDKRCWGYWKITKATIYYILFRCSKCTFVLWSCRATKLAEKFIWKKSHICIFVVCIFVEYEFHLHWMNSFLEIKKWEQPSRADSSITRILRKHWRYCSYIFFWHLVNMTLYEFCTILIISLLGFP